MTRRIPALLVVAFTATTLAAADDGTAHFREYVEPLLKTHCYECHSHEAGDASGGLVLDSKAGWSAGGDSGPAIVPGKPEKSLLLTAVRYGDENLQMPPDGKLSGNDLAILEKWNREGAADPRTDGRAAERRTIDLAKGREHWAFRPVRDPEPPAVEDDSWPRDDVDRFVLRKLEEADLAPAADASPAKLLRRVHYDLTGLPPSPQEIAAFEAAWTESPGRGEAAYEAVVDRLLASRGFGEKWGRHWLDLARYADSNGSSFNPPFRAAWRYRNWVVDSFEQDRPFDEFVRMQLAGDLLPWETQRQRDENLVATGYLMLGSKVLGLFDKEQLELDVVDEQLDVIGKSLLGMTVACTRCHDHKFDPIPQRDYYALAGILTSTRTLDSRMGGPKADESDWSRRGLGPDGDERLHEFLAEHRHEWVDLTGDVFRGRRKVRELERDGEESSDELEKARAELAEHEKRLAELEAKMPPYAMAAADGPRPADEALRIRGVPASHGDLVPRGFLQVAAFEGQPDVPADASGRLELARWITSPENPLTARVFVNRVWKHLLREGLVRSLDNFGTTGEKPSHTELLDHLATRFVDDGWRVKPLVRGIVLSRAYRMSVDRSSAARESDPENRLLAGQNRRRLEPEEIRDTLLLLAGRLDRTPAEGMLDHLPIGDVSNLGDALDIQDDRRTVYQPVIRTLEPTVLQVFDFANPAMTTGSRPKTIVAPQALYFLNADFVQESAVATAKHLVAARSGNRNVHGLVDDAFVRIVCRTPTDRERAVLVAYLENQFEGPPGPTDHDVFKLCQSILASTQFQFLE